MTVRVQFDYDPDEPDDDDPTGVSEAEYNRLMENLMALGADGITVERKPS